jgi:hypothetical protein
MCKQLNAKRTTRELGIKSRTSAALLLSLAFFFFSFHLVVVVVVAVGGVSVVVVVVVIARGAGPLRLQNRKRLALVFLPSLFSFLSSFHPQSSSYFSPSPLFLSLLFFGGPPSSYAK